MGNNHRVSAVKYFVVGCCVLALPAFATDSPYSIAQAGSFFCTESCIMLPLDAEASPQELTRGEVLAAVQSVSAEAETQPAIRALNLPAVQPVWPALSSRASFALQATIAAGSALLVAAAAYMWTGSLRRRIKALNEAIQQRNDNQAFIEERCASNFAKAQADREGRMIAMREELAALQKSLDGERAIRQKTEETLRHTEVDVSELRRTELDLKEALQNASAAHEDLLGKVADAARATLTDVSGSLATILVDDDPENRVVIPDFFGPAQVDQPSPAEKIAALLDSSAIATSIAERPVSEAVVLKPAARRPRASRKTVKRRNTQCEQDVGTGAPASGRAIKKTVAQKTRSRLRQQHQG
jgi:hypothetical protein